VRRGPRFGRACGPSRNAVGSGLTTASTRGSGTRLVVGGDVGVGRGGDESGQVFGNEKLTTALLYRLCYRAEILVTSGPSYRTRTNPMPGRSSGDADAVRRTDAPVNRTSRALDMGGSVE
jgi:hypothetical protein